MKNPTEMMGFVSNLECRPAKAGRHFSLKGLFIRRFYLALKSFLRISA
jgi:hypothetical protein